MDPCLRRGDNRVPSAVLPYVGAIPRDRPKIAFYHSLQLRTFYLTTSYTYPYNPSMQLWS